MEGVKTLYRFVAKKLTQGLSLSVKDEILYGLDDVLERQMDLKDMKARPNLGDAESDSPNSMHQPIGEPSADRRVEDQTSVWSSNINNKTPSAVLATRDVQTALQRITGDALTSKVAVVASPLACGALRVIFQSAADTQLRGLLEAGMDPFATSLMVGIGCSLFAKVLTAPLMPDKCLPVKGLGVKHINLLKVRHSLKEVSLTRSLAVTAGQMGLLGGLHWAHSCVSVLPSAEAELCAEAALGGAMAAWMCCSLRGAQGKAAGRVLKKLSNRPLTVATLVAADCAFFAAVESSLAILGQVPVVVGF
jgi:hypothetical protein